MKLCAPYFIHAIPYPTRIVLFVALSSMGMLLIALTPAYTDGGTISTKMAGVILASLSSGGGELSFLGLTHFYGPFSLAAWGSGTGGAGLIGAGAYAVATTSFGLSVKRSLLVSSMLPAVMLISFFVLLPKGPLRREAYSTQQQKGSRVTASEDEEADEYQVSSSDPSIRSREDEGLLGSSSSHNLVTTDSYHSTSQSHITWQAHFISNVNRSRRLFFP